MSEELNCYNCGGTESAHHEGCPALRATPPSPSTAHPDVRREARNKVCIDGHLNETLDAVLRSNSPDGIFNLLGSLAENAIDIALGLVSPSTASEVGELPPLPPGLGAGMFIHADVVRDYGKACYAAGRGAAVRDYVNLNEAALAAKPAAREVDVEAERKLFEASGITSRLWRNTEPGYAHEYGDNHTQMAWKTWLAARRTQEGVRDCARRIRMWLKAQANAEKDPKARAAFIEAHNAALAIIEGRATQTKENQHEGK